MQPRTAAPDSSSRGYDCSTEFFGLWGLATNLSSILGYITTGDYGSSAEGMRSRMVSL